MPVFIRGAKQTAQQRYRFSRSSVLGGEADGEQGDWTMERQSDATLRAS